MVFLPPATKLGQSYVFTHVCDSVHRGGGIPTCIPGGIPACLAAGLQGGVSQALQQVSRGGGWYPSMPCRILGPHPGGKFRGLTSRGGLQAHTQGVSPGPHPRGYPNMHRGRPPQWLLLRDSTHPTGMHSCFCKAFPLQNYHLKKLP